MWRDDRPFGTAEPRIADDREYIMSTRKFMSLTLAAVLLSAPFAVTADAATRARHPARHTMKPARAGRMAPRDGGSAAVDALNEQALARARGTAQ